MKILFLDQSGKLGGAELSLADVAGAYQESCLVGLFSDGPFRELLEQNQTPVQVLTEQSIQVRKDSKLLQSLGSINTLLPLVSGVAAIAREYDIIYANTQKALVVGALASLLAGRPLVYHLRDILSADHFSSTNRRIAVTLANFFAKAVIANSEATQSAFIESGGRKDIAHVIYNGFEPEVYNVSQNQVEQTRQELGFGDRFIVGHFSRLSPWKGQHVLLEALTYCPENVGAIFVGDALFGEQEYVDYLHQQVKKFRLEDRVQFLGFCSDVVPLMSACNLVAHTSTAPEPFGRVIIEAMLCNTPVIAAAAGGAVELIDHGNTGWLTTPGDAKQLSETIQKAQVNPEQTSKIAGSAFLQARQKFHLKNTNVQISEVLACLHQH